HDVAAYKVVEQEGAEIVDVNALGLRQRAIGLCVRIDSLHLDRETQFLRRLIGDLDDVRVGPANLDQLDVLDVLGPDDREASHQARANSDAGARRRRIQNLPTLELTL